MKHLWLIFFCAASISVFAQTEYTYFSDRRFFSSDDLVGYQFVPRIMETPRESKKTLKPGEVTFGITGNNLYVTGEGIGGVYNINSINSPQFGYQLTLMNPRNPTSKGVLKVILTKGAFVDALIFKKDQNEPEIIFVLPEMTKESRAAMKSYFTDWGETTIESPNEIWGKTIRPFFKVYLDSRVQEKFSIADSVKVKFSLKEVIKGNPLKEKKEAQNQPETIAQAEPLDLEESKTIKQPENQPAENEESDSPFFSAPKTKKEDDSGSPFFSSPKPKEDKETGSPFFSSSSQPKKAEPKPEIIEEVEPKTRKITAEIELEEVPDNPPMEKKKKAPKLKIEERYSIDLTFREKYEDGTSTLHRLSFPVKKWTERSNENAGPGEEKFQIEFQGEGNKVFFLYLTSERTVTAFEWRNEKWLVRD